MVASPPTVIEKAQQRVSRKRRRRCGGNFSPVEKAQHATALHTELNSSCDDFFENIFSENVSHGDLENVPVNCCESPQLTSNTADLYEVLENVLSDEDVPHKPDNAAQNAPVNTAEFVPLNAAQNVVNTAELVPLPLYHLLVPVGVADATTNAGCQGVHKIPTSSSGAPPPSLPPLSTEDVPFVYKVPKAKRMRPNNVPRKENSDRLDPRSSLQPGVRPSRTSGKWEAHITLPGAAASYVHLGTFPSQEIAAQVRLRAVVLKGQHYGIDDHALKAKLRADLPDCFRKFRKNVARATTEE